MQQTVVILGASDKEQRFSNQALKLLQEHGHQVIPVHPKLKEIDGISVKANLDEINQSIDSLTLYLGEQRSQPLIDKIIALRPKRVIFNPGSESTVLADALTKADINYVHDCTLVMLRNKQFDLPTLP